MPSHRHKENENRHSGGRRLQLLVLVLARGPIVPLSKIQTDGRDAGVDYYFCTKTLGSAAAVPANNPLWVLIGHRSGRRIITAVKNTIASVQGLSEVTEPAARPASAAHKRNGLGHRRRSGCDNRCSMAHVCCGVSKAQSLPRHAVIPRE